MECFSQSFVTFKKEIDSGWLEMILGKDEE